MPLVPLVRVSFNCKCKGELQTKTASHLARPALPWNPESERLVPMQKRSGQHEVGEDKLEL